MIMTKTLIKITVMIMMVMVRMFTVLIKAINDENKALKNDNHPSWHYHCHQLYHSTSRPPIPCNIYSRNNINTYNKFKYMMFVVFVELQLITKLIVYEL